MTQESTDPEHHYDEEREEFRDIQEKMSDKRYHSFPSHRRRTHSENAAVDQTKETQLVYHPHLRRRAKSGDEYKSREPAHCYHPLGKLRTKSHNFVGHQPEDKHPLLSKAKNIEQVCLDTFAQVAKCTMCHCTHSDSSSCDNSTSCSSHSQSYEKVCSNPSGCPKFMTIQDQSALRKSNLDLIKADLRNNRPSQYSHLNQLESGVENSGIDLFTEKQLINHHIVQDHLPAVGMCIGRSSNDQQEQSDMLLENEPSKAGETSKFANRRISIVRAYFGLGILLFANTLNYMDRYTVAGVLLDVKKFYSIGNGEVGLLQTSFIVSYMVFSPIFGFLGDRYSRKVIMSIGIFSWSLITLGSSFIGRDDFKIFLLMRALVGIGEASYSTIAPTIIADLFVDNSRTKALSVFYFAIPVGSGLGYIAGSKFAYALGDWQWALRITPGLGIICVILILLVVKEPQRGAAEGGVHIHSTSWGADICYLFKHKSFLLSSAGFTCVAFVAGSMALWTPTYMYYSIRQRPEDASESTVSMIFGLITCASGFTGVALGSWTASKLRHKIGTRADPLVCAVGLIGCAPFLFLSLHLSRSYPIITWVLIFIGETLLSLNWALVTDILLYIIVPTRRATAEAVQILMSHALGDAGSPYIVGQVADTIADLTGFPAWRAGQYLSLQYAMYICCFVAVLGGGFFLLTSLYIVEDKKKVELIIKESRIATQPMPDPLTAETTNQLESGEDTLNNSAGQVVNT